MSELKHFSLSDIQSFDRLYRMNMINSISGYKPANLIGTYSEKGNANLSIITSVVHLGSDPALIGYIQRPVSELSHTYKNIIKNKHYSINHVHEDFIEKAHYTSAKFDEGISEFEACGLTEESIREFHAPFVKQSKVKIGLKHVREIPIDLNNTILMIGQIEHIFIEKNAILKDGSINLNLVNDVCVSGLDTYHKVNRIKTFPYAKVQSIPNL
ncbi:flavin reductase family protein [candidate division KSB1 bacterium]